MPDFRFLHLEDLYMRGSPIQTLKAWRPFEEVRMINYTIQSSDLGEEFPEGMMYWVYAVVNLRTVGHVLAKIDAKKSIRHGEVIADKWKSWKTERELNWIFWKFIEEERNNILKTYDIGVDYDLYHAAFDEDGIQLIREAIYWWRTQLDEIESRLL